MKPDFTLSQNLEFRCEFITDRQPERAVFDKHTVQFLHPLPTPRQILVGRSPVLINIVFKSDVERRIRKGKVNRAGLNVLQQLEAIALVDIVELQIIGTHA